MFFVVAMGLVHLIGCGPSEPQPTASLTGKVALDGSPAPAGSTIQFTDSTTGKASVGTIGADGSYIATTGGQQKIFVGTYKVSVVGPDPNISPEAAMEPGFVPPEDPIPEKYRDANTSGESVEVKDGENTYDLDMKKDGSAPAPSATEG